MNDERIVAWLDGELSSEEAAQLEAEIAADPVLLADVDQMRSIKTAIQSMGRERAPRNYTLDANEYGRVPRERSSLFSGWAVPALALAAVVLIAAIVLNQFPLGSGSSNDTAMMEDGASTEEMSRETANLPELDESDASSDSVEEESMDEDMDAASDAEFPVAIQDSTLSGSGSGANLEISPEDDNEQSEAEEVAQSYSSADASESTSEPMLVTVAPQPTPSPSPTPVPSPTPKSIARRRIQLPTTFEIPTDTISSTAGISGTNGISGTVGETSDGSWEDALRDLTIWFLIFLLFICIGAFGIGIWALMSRHQH